MKLTERQKQIDRYLRCAANLYGHITPRAFLVIFNRYNRPKLLKAELISYQDKLNRQQNLNYILYDNAIIHALVSENTVDRIMAYQQGKAFYIPTEDELLKYESKSYYENSVYARQLKAFLQNEMKVNMFTADAFMNNLAWLIRTEEPLQMQLQSLENFNIQFGSMQRANDFYGLLMAFSNHARKWANCGYTPDELRQKYMKNTCD